MHSFLSPRSSLHFLCTSNYSIILKNPGKFVIKLIIITAKRLNKWRTKSSQEFHWENLSCSLTSGRLKICIMIQTSGLSSSPNISSMTGDMRKVMVTMVAASRMKVRVVPVTTRLVVLSCRSLWQCKVRSRGEWGLGKHQSTLLLCRTESLFWLFPGWTQYVLPPSIPFYSSQKTVRKQKLLPTFRGYGFVISCLSTYCVLCNCVKSDDDPCNQPINWSSQGRTMQPTFRPHWADRCRHL